MSILKIKHIDELFDFEKIANYDNYELGLTVCPTNAVLSFAFEIELGGVITTFEARKIRVVNGSVIIDESFDILSDITITQTGDWYSYYTNTTLSSNLGDGVYYYYLSDGTYERKSELFCVSTDILFGKFLEDNNGDLIEDNAGELIFEP